jgi:hypothetical protein
VEYFPDNPPPRERHKRERSYLQRAAATGLVDERRPLFPARTRPPRHTPRFLVPAGTPAAVRNIHRGEWAPFTTRKVSGFERFERLVRDGANTYYEFRADGGWLLLVQSRYVRRREDGYLHGRGMSCEQTGLPSWSSNYITSPPASTAR